MAYIIEDQFCSMVHDDFKENSISFSRWFIFHAALALTDQLWNIGALKKPVPCEDRPWVVSDLTLEISWMTSLR